MFAALLVPLVLGGCAVPASVQIASLLADGVSVIATDKTLGDHALSAVTKQDCAVWRMVNGQEICRDAEPDGPVMVADAEDAKSAQAPEIKITTLEPLPAPANSPGAQAFEVASLELVSIKPAPAVLAALPQLNPARADEPALAPKRVPEPVKAYDGTFYVIASFRHMSNAERFARNHAALAARILAGTAKGKTVYRVATGPVEKAQRRLVRARLLRAGFDDAWALTLISPKIVVELAALN